VSRQAHNRRIPTDDDESHRHSQWDCKYQVVLIPKGRRKTLDHQLRAHWGEVFRKRASRKESRIEEGRLMPDPVHRLISNSPKYAVSQVVGSIKGKNALHWARGYGECRRNVVGQSFGARSTLYRRWAVTKPTIKEYIRHHEPENQRLEPLTLWR